MNRASSFHSVIPLAGFACAWVLGCHSSSAQEALRSALAGDRSYQQRSSPAIPRNDNLRAGPVNFSARADYSVGWNDNVRLVPDNETADFSHHIRGAIQGVWPVTQDSQLNFGLGVGYVAYMQETDLNRLIIDPDSEFAWDIRVKDSVYTLYDRVSYTQEVISQGSLSGTAQLPRLENTVGARARWFPSDYVFDAGYGHHNLISEDTEFAYLSHSSEQFFGRAGYRFAPVTTVGVEGSAAITDFSSDQRGDYWYFSAGPFVNWQITEYINLNVRGGYVYYSFEATPANPVLSPASELNSYYAGVDVRHILTDYVTHGVSANRSVQQGLNQGSRYNEVFDARYFIGWAFHRSASLNLSLWYDHGNEPRVTFLGPVDDIYDRFGWDIGLRTEPLTHLSIGIGYRYVLKDSERDTQDYRQNAVSVNISYRF